MDGTVKWFDDKKGFGFITLDGGEGDCFVHYSGIIGSGRRTLEEGQRVTFETLSDAKGLKAVKVQPLERDRPEAGKMAGRAAQLFAAGKATRDEGRQACGR